MPTEDVIVEADGGSRGNPGPAGYGAVVLDPGTGEVLAERAAALGVTTNNVAEYSGLIAGLEAAAELGAHRVEVRMDSKLVVEQMAGRWKVKHPGLRPLVARATALLGGFEQVTFAWIPRARNTRADALANAAMDAARDGRAAGDESRDEAQEEAREGDPAETAAGWEPRLAPPTRLVLLRHGETTHTEAGRYSGRGDVPLTARGEAQARAAAREVLRLAPEAVAIVSSPLARTYRTAELVAEAYREAAARTPDGPDGVVPDGPRALEIRTDPALVECDFGAWEGLTFADVRRKWPGDLDAWLADPGAVTPAGESFEEVAVRVRAAVRTLRETYQGRTVVVVSHVTPIKLLLCDALDGGRVFLHRLHLSPAGISILDSWPDGGISVRLVNAVAEI